MSTPNPAALRGVLSVKPLRYRGTYEVALTDGRRFQVDLAKHPIHRVQKRRSANAKFRPNMLDPVSRFGHLYKRIMKAVEEYRRERQEEESWS